jgi:DNA-binding transcriptional LysR family regulator
MLAAVEEGQGIAYLFEDQVTSQLENGSVVRMLESWCPSFPGYYISYPRQRLMSSAFAALLGVLRANR